MITREISTDDHPVPRRSSGRRRSRLRDMRLTVAPLALAALVGIGAVTADATQATAQDVWNPWASARYVGQTQEHAQWCFVASASISLDSLGVHVGQTRLARETRTSLTTGMTDPVRYIQALNVDAARAGVAYSETSEPDASDLGELLASEMHTGAPVQSVYASALPYTPPSAAHEGHAIVVVGVDSRDQLVRVWDPCASRQHVHVMTWSQLYAASQGPGETYVLTPTR